jgi:hypothetical protein
MPDDPMLGVSEGKVVQVSPCPMSPQLSGAFVQVAVQTPVVAAPPV